MNQIFDYWNHFCDTQKEIMRVENDNIKFTLYNYQEDKLPYWYDQYDFCDDYYTYDNEYNETFFDKTISVEEESIIDNNYFIDYGSESDSESDYETEWTVV